MAPVVPIVAAIAGAAVASEVGAAATAFFACDVVGADIAGALGVSASTLGTITGGLAGFAVSSAVNVVGSRLFGTKNSSTPVTPSHARMVQSAVESHKIVYGRAKVAGPIVYIGTTNTGPTEDGSTPTGTNLFVHMAIALTGHQIDGFETIYFNNEPVTLDANGYVTSWPYTMAGNVGIDPRVTYSISTAVRSQEVTTVTTTATHNIQVGDKVRIASVAPDGAMNGAFIVASVPSGTTFTYNNGGLNASSTGGTVTNETNHSSTNSFARIKKFTGAIGQSASSDMIAEVPGWDSTHQLNGIAYLYVRLQYDPTVYSQGIPNISAVVRGKQVYDPRTSTTAWSENAALCIRDYLTSDYGFSCSASEINDTYTNAAANHCDESVTLSTGGTQSRYTMDGVVDTASTPIQNLNAMTSALVGTVTYVQGQFRIYAGVYDSTAGNIDSSMLAGSVKITTHTTRQQLFNCVQGTYVDPNANYTPTDFPPILNSTYIAADGGQSIYTDLQLPFTKHPEAAQRIASLIMNEARNDTILELPLNHNALQYSVWDTITYTDTTTELGWTNQVFRIKKFAMAGLGIITLQCQLESSSAYTWTAGTAYTLPSVPLTTLPNPTIVTAPTGLSYTSRAVTTTNGTVYNLVIQWTQHPDAFVTNGGQIEIQYKLHSDTTWRPISPVNGSSTFADIVSSSINTAYDVKARAINILGAHSAWQELDNCIIGSSGGATFTNDWGSVANAVGTSNDWGSVANPVGTTNDWGPVV